MSTLIDEIRVARETVARLEAETSESGHLLRLSKEKLRKARQELDTLLVELVSGQSRYPLPGFDQVVPPHANGNGQPAAADTTPVRLLEPPLETKIRRRKKGASAP